MKKAAIVIADIQLGGGQRSALNFASALSKDHEVTLIVFHTVEQQYEVPYRLVNIKCPDKFNVVGKAYNVLKRAFKLRRHFKAEKYDYIFGFMETANFPTVIASSKSILSVHCNPHELNSYESILARALYPRAQHVVAVSEDVATILREDYKLKKVSRIYNLVPFEDVQREGANAYQHDKPYLVALGRLSEVKRLDILVEAYSKSALKQEVDLLIVGEGSERNSLEKQIDTLGLEEKVILTGSQSNPFTYLKGAEFLMLSSRTEAFPMVLIEALVLSCPVVATDCPTGPREIVIQNENGLLVENENVDALSAAMDKLYSDKQLLAHCRENALNSVQHLAADKVVEEWLALGDEHSQKATAELVQES